MNPTDPKPSLEEQAKAYALAEIEKYLLYDSCAPRIEKDFKAGHASGLAEGGLRTKGTQVIPQRIKRLR